MKLKLILITVLAFGSIAYAQGFKSNLSIGAGFEGIFPAATFTKSAAESDQFNANTQDTTNSVGAVGDVRYDFGHHSALGVSVTVNRSSELFYNGNNGGAPDRVQSNNVEFIGTYIFRLPSNEHVKPYAMFGGGVVHFSPNQDYTTGLTPSTDTKPAFAYGFGADFLLSSHWGLRLQYRGLLRGDPDFKLLANTSSPFGTGLKTHVVEPSIQLVYHF